MPNEDFELGLGVKDAKGSINKTAKGLKDVEMSAKKAGKAVEGIGSSANAATNSVGKTKEGVKGLDSAAEAAGSSMERFSKEARTAWKNIKQIAGTFGLTLGVIQVVNAAMKLTDNIIQRQKKGLEDNLKTYQALSSLRAMEEGGVIKAGAVEAAKRIAEESGAKGFKISEQQALAATAIMAPRAALLGIDLDRLMDVIPKVAAQAAATGKDISLAEAARTYIMPMLQSGEAGALAQIGFTGAKQDELAKMATVTEKVNLSLSNLEEQLAKADPVEALLKAVMKGGKEAESALALLGQRMSRIAAEELEEGKEEVDVRKKREIAASFIKLRAAELGYDVDESRWEHIGEVIATPFRNLFGGIKELQQYMDPKQPWMYWKTIYEDVRPREGVFDPYKTPIDAPGGANEIIAEFMAYLQMRYGKGESAGPTANDIKPEVKVDVNEAPK